jgi:hypothetical protein
MPARICPRCRSPITSEPSALRAVSGPLARRLSEVTLCRDCDWLRQAELFDVLNSGLQPDESPDHAWSSVATGGSRP